VKRVVGIASGLLALSLVLAIFAWSLPLVAETSAVPVGLQAELTAKLAAHDKGMPARAGSALKIAILVKKGNAESASTATHLQAAFAGLGAIAGLPHQEQIVDFTDAAALAALIKAESLAIVYLTQGFDGDVESIRSTLGGVSVMTCATVPDYVARGGAVIGFDLVSGKSKILVNLRQAKKQSVNLDSNVLTIATVFK
jgi:YfiR/HmsC-like